MPPRSVSSNARVGRLAGRLLVCALVVGTAPAAAQPDPEATFLGTVGPNAKRVVLAAGAGVVLTAPQATARLRLGVGRGAFIEAAYDNIAFLGHAGELIVGWGRAVTDRADLGLQLRSEIGTLRAINFVGIDFAAFDFGNDWLAGLDLVATWRREAGARLTGRIGVDMTLADYRFTDFRVAGFELDFGFRGVELMLQGEWPLADRRHLFIRLEGVIPTHTEVTPIGFLPTATAGVAWYL